MEISQIQAATTEQMEETDLVAVLDKSGSMAKPSKRFTNRNRWKELMEDTIRLCNEFSTFDKDGITVIPFSSDTTIIDNVTGDKVEQIFTEHTPAGSTDMAAALHLAVGKARANPKKVVIVIFTDGEPDDEAAVIDIINKAGNEFGRPKIGFCFVQVGDDPGATKFLQKLDNDLKVDVCCTISAKDAEKLSAQKIVWGATNA